MQLFTFSFLVIFVLESFDYVQVIFKLMLKSSLSHSKNSKKKKKKFKLINPFSTNVPLMYLKLSNVFMRNRSEIEFFLFIKATFSKDVQFSNLEDTFFAYYGK